MIHNYLKKNTSDGVTKKLCKSNDTDAEKQIFEPIYKDIADQNAVKLEIGDVILTFNKIIKKAKIDVDDRKSLNPIKYRQRGFYSQDLNATIKEYIIKEVEKDPVFNSYIRIRSNQGSQYFIIKDKYILYVKQLYGSLNKPQSFPTPNSNKLCNGTLSLGLSQHTPVLFIGPNVKQLKQADAFVTSLISRKEVNWTLSSVDLFSNTNVIPITTIIKNEDTEKEILTVKDGLGKQKKEIN
ncbi:MAG: hypothetical protein RSF68_01065 [Myroides sp.]